MGISYTFYFSVYNVLTAVAMKDLDVVTDLITWLNSCYTVEFKTMYVNPG